MSGLEALGSQLRERLSSLEDGVLVHDAAGTIIAASPGTERLLGTDSGKLIGRKSPLEAGAAFDEAGVPWKVDKCPSAVCRKTGEPQKVVLRFDRPDRRIIWLSFDAHPLISAGGQRYGVATVFKDVTDAHLAEATRQRLFEEAKEALRTRDEFLAVAAHELKTPLTALQLHLQSMLRTSDIVIKQDPALLTGKLRATVRQAERLNHLVDVLMDVARISTGRLELNRSTMDLASLVKDVVERNEEELRRAGCEVRASITTEVLGDWDIVRLDQVITNLVSNASKYGRGKPVEIEVSRAENVAYVQVRDFGIGIPHEDQARIFGRFERAVADTNYGGLGLGLWVVREIVEAHGGRIVLTSQAGSGATFRVELPAASN